jgi:hypothetical protein
MLDKKAGLYRLFLCPWMGGMSQGARDGGETHAHGWAVCLKEPGMVVRRMPMDGRYVSRSQGWR